MKTLHFQTSAHAKCILAGEHAVLRGSPALVLPVRSKFITLGFQNAVNELNIVPHINSEKRLLPIFTTTLQYALQQLGIDILDLRGKFFLENTIPIGSGLGFSAALCVVITRWLIWNKKLPASQLFSFAHHLENRFHGQSSGVDIAGAITEQLIRFERPHTLCNIQSEWEPELYLSYSGCSKITVSAIGKVDKLRTMQPSLMDQIDKEMHECVSMIEAALQQKKLQGFQLLACAMEQAQNCFKQWNLMTDSLQHHLDQLYELGASSAKPTGAGYGGYVLSLWDKPPTKSPIEFIPIYINDLSLFE